MVGACKYCWIAFLSNNIIVKSNSLGEDNTNFQKEKKIITCSLSSFIFWIKILLALQKDILFFSLWEPQSVICEIFEDKY